MNIGLLVGSVLFNWVFVNIKWLLSFVLAFIIAGILNMYQKNITSSFFTYSCLFGLGSGINLMLSLQSLWEYFPAHREFVTAYVFGVQTIGIIIFI